MSEEDFVRVGTVTRTELHCIDGLASVEVALAEMRRLQVSSLVIARRHPGDEYGLITVRDIANEVVSKNRSTARISVYEIMAKPALTLDAEMNVKYAIRLIGRLGLGRALVLKQGELLGLVTLRDLVLAYVEGDDIGV